MTAKRYRLPEILGSSEMDGWYDATNANVRFDTPVGVFWVERRLLVEVPPLVAVTDVTLPWTGSDIDNCQAVVRISNSGARVVDATKDSAGDATHHAYEPDVAEAKAHALLAAARAVREGSGRWSCETCGATGDGDTSAAWEHLDTHKPVRRKRWQVIRRLKAALVRWIDPGPEPVHPVDAAIDRGNALKRAIWKAEDAGDEAEVTRLRSEVAALVDELSAWRLDG